MAPIDPGALLEMEKSARGIATEMTHVMDNLRNSLYAVSGYTGSGILCRCVQQTVSGDHCSGDGSNTAQVVGISVQDVRIYV